MPGDSLEGASRLGAGSTGVSKARAGRLAGLHEQTIAHVERGRGRWVSSMARGAIEGLLDN